MLCNNLFSLPFILDGIVAMGETFRRFAWKHVHRLVCAPKVFGRRANGTSASAWTIARQLKESHYMATRCAVAAQNFDYFLVLDFEATCDNKQQLVPQVILLDYRTKKRTVLGVG